MSRFPREARNANKCSCIFGQRRFVVIIGKRMVVGSIFLICVCAGPEFRAGEAREEVFMRIMTERPVDRAVLWNEPSFASLRGAGGGWDPVCGGVAVAKRFILTAQHCSGLKTAEFPASGDVVNILERCEHPCFEDDPAKGFSYDLLLLRTSTIGENFVWVGGYADPADGDLLVFLARDGGLLRSEPFGRHEKQDCRDAWKKVDSDEVIGDEEFCAGSKDSSAGHGGSGGPLFRVTRPLPDFIVTERLVGIFSTSTKRNDEWDIYTEIDTDWLEKVMADPEKWCDFPSDEIEGLRQELGCSAGSP